ncbi:MAG: penicillin-binding protein 2 [Chloroflexota bacterium]|nr:penicillin-binding protein 2 [Chloroflexota bacterium]MDE3194028.1 penicillin-binding protein 2 [Chloroflexota bacterium]
MAPVSSARLRTLFALFAVLSIVLSARVAYWQTVARPGLLERANGQVRSDEVLHARRGTIFDRSGAILAASVDLRSLYAIPARIRDKQKVADDLGILLGRAAGPIYDRLTSGADWVFIQRRLPEATANAIADLHVDGLGFEEEPKRLYPNGDLAAHLLGFVSDDGAGQDGVEGKYDGILRGTDGKLVAERDPADREIALGLRESVAPRNGADLTLTVDLAIQTSAERELRAAVQRESAVGGSIVVLDPRDGAVRAMASYPTFDPGAVAAAKPEALRDRVVGWAYEPGSVMKAITMAAGLETGVVTPNTTYNDVGYADIGGRRLSNALGRAWGPSTMTQVIEHSANAGAVFVAKKLGEQRLYDALVRFGIGRPTGVDLAGEIGGDVRPLAQWYPVDLGTAAFGQGLTATPLQLATVYAAIANGGTLYRPYVVASWRDADGEHRTAPAAVRRVVSSQTASTLRDMLVSSVDKGLAHGAFLSGFSVAGKTGTAQIPSPDGRYVDDQYISSFAGFVPADDPYMVVVVVLDRPQSRLFGTTTAMSVFRGVAEDTLRYALIQPDRKR